MPNFPPCPTRFLCANAGEKTTWLEQGETQPALKFAKSNSPLALQGGFFKFSRYDKLPPCPEVEILTPWLHRVLGPTPSYSSDAVVLRLVLLLG